MSKRGKKSTEEKDIIPASQKTLEEYKIPRKKETKEVIELDDKKCQSGVTEEIVERLIRVEKQVMKIITVTNELKEGLQKLLDLALQEEGEDYLVEK